MYVPTHILICILRRSGAPALPNFLFQWRFVYARIGITRRNKVRPGCLQHGRGARKGVFVSYQAETPFDSIEGSHEYVAMLAEALDEARRDVDAELAAAERDCADRRKEALLLVSYNLSKLHLHITTSRRLLNDLRTLRRLLLAERGLFPAEESEIATGGGD
jgi:hypothetical protein